MGGGKGVSVVTARVIGTSLLLRILLFCPHFSAISGLCLRCIQRRDGIRQQPERLTPRCRADQPFFVLAVHHRHIPQLTLQKLGQRLQQRLQRHETLWRPPAVVKPKLVSREVFQSGWQRPAANSASARWPAASKRPARLSTLIWRSHWSATYSSNHWVNWESSSAGRRVTAASISRTVMGRKLRATRPEDRLHIDFSLLAWIVLPLSFDLDSSSYPRLALPTREDHEVHGESN